MDNKTCRICSGHILSLSPLCWDVRKIQSGHRNSEEETPMAVVGSQILCSELSLEEPQLRIWGRMCFLMHSDDLLTLTLAFSSAPTREHRK